MMAVKLALVAITTSYLTLAVADASAAGGYWAPYAVITFVLAITNLILDLRGRQQ